jgi:Tfp pilus assembly protein PilN
MDLKKEIKVSDLFKRGQKKGKPEEELTGPKDTARSGAGTSVLKKDIKLSFRRSKEAKEPTAVKPPKAAKPPKSEKPPKAAKPPKEPKAPKKARSSKESTANGRNAPPLPEIPLMRAFNLLPKEDSRQAREARPNTARLALAVAALVTIAALASAFLLMSARVSDKKQQYDDLRGQLAALNVPAEEPANGEDQALVEERQSRTTALASALGGRVAWDRLLREISLVLPEDVWLTKLTATAPPPSSSATAPPPQGTTDPGATAPGTSSVTITGNTYDQDSVAQLLSRLAVIPELSSVKLLSSTRMKVGQRDVFEFSVAATVKPPIGATA